MEKQEKRAIVQAAKEAKKQQGKHLLSAQTLLWTRKYCVQTSFVCVVSYTGGRGEAQTKGGAQDF